MSALDICGGPFGVVKPDGGLGLSRHLRPACWSHPRADVHVWTQPCSVPRTETMREGAIMRLMVAIGAALVAVAMLLTPASAQRDLPALPAPDELPTGFRTAADGEAEEANGARR